MLISALKRKKPISGPYDYGNYVQTLNYFLDIMLAEFGPTMDLFYSGEQHEI